MQPRRLHTEFDALLRRAYMPQVEFAELCGVTAKAVNNWCRGRQEPPQWAWMIAKIVDAVDLRVEPQFLWHETLGVQPPFSLAKASRARASLAKKLHPDMGGDVESMQRINAAFDMARKEMAS